MSKAKIKARKEAERKERIRQQKFRAERERIKTEKAIKDASNIKSASQIIGQFIQDVVQMVKTKNTFKNELSSKVKTILETKAKDVKYINLDTTDLENLPKRVDELIDPECNKLLLSIGKLEDVSTMEEKMSIFSENIERLGSLVDAYNKIADEYTTIVERIQKYTDTLPKPSGTDVETENTDDMFDEIEVASDTKD